MRKLAALLIQTLFVGTVGTQPPGAAATHNKKDVLPGGHAAPATPASPASTADRPWILDEAVSHYREGDLALAEQVLEQWRNTDERSPSSGLGCVLLGRIHSERERWGQAIEVLESCTPPDTVSDLHAILAGDALRKKGFAERAIPYYKRTAGQLHSPHAPRAGFELANAYFEAGRWRRAQKQYERMLDNYPESPQWAMARYRLARSLEHQKRRRDAMTRYTRLARVALEGSKARNLATTGIKRLKSQGVKEPKRSDRDRMDWAVRLQKDRRWPAAILAFEALLPRTRSKAKKSEIHYRTARCLEAEDRYQEALVHLGKVRGGGRSGDVLSARIRILRKTGQTKEAIALTTGRAGRSKKVRGLAAAKVWYEDGHYDKAYALYSKYLRTKHNRDNQWLMAWVAYRAGEYEEAIDRFGALVGKRKIRKHKAAYWQARALQKGGRGDEAVTAFSEVAEADPVGYYGIQAANRLLDMGDVAAYMDATGAEAEHVPDADVRKRVGGTIRWTDAESLNVEEAKPT
ncbi:MAG: tetratricopeptide (TPR) repeat protein, partial [Myxococcota bacterium]